MYSATFNAYASKIFQLCTLTESTVHLIIKARYNTNIIMIKALEENTGDAGGWGEVHYIKLGGVMCSFMCTQRNYTKTSVNRAQADTSSCLFCHSCDQRHAEYACVLLDQAANSLDVWWTFMATLRVMFTPRLYQPTGLHATQLVYSLVSVSLRRDTLYHWCVFQPVTPPYVSTTESFGVNHQLGLSWPISVCLGQRSTAIRTTF